MLKAEGNKALVTAKNLVEGENLKVKTYMREGHAGNEIIQVSEKEDVQLIVVGSHGKTQIDRLLLGSVSSYVVKYSTITTMVVRG